MKMFCSNCHGLLRTKKVGKGFNRYCPKCDIGEKVDTDAKSMAKPAPAERQPLSDEALKLKEKMKSGKVPEIDLFPHENIREGQKEFIKDVALAIKEGKHLLAYAPTGLGKTVGVLVPGIKHSLQTGRKVFFLTSRQSQHNIAIETIRAIREVFDVDIRAVDIISKQVMCPRDISKEHPAVFNEFCKLEQRTNTCKFYSKYEKGLVEKVCSDVMHVEDLVDLARSKGICPHRLALEAAARSNVVICDYNYIFSDISETVLNAMEVALEDTVIIVDEAHNLPDRIRGHLSQDLTMNRLEDALAECRKDKQVQFFLKHLRKVVAQMLEEAPKGSEMLIDHRPFIDRVEGILKQTLDDTWDLDVFIEKLLEIGEKKILDGAPYSAAMEVGAFLDGFRQDLAGMIHVLSDVDNTKLYFRLLDPSAVSEAIFNSAHASILMSGTLFPTNMYADLLGIPAERAIFASYESPFPKENRPVYAVPEVTTLYKKRGQKMYEKIATGLKTAASEVPGNIAVFFPSYKILADVQYPLEKMGITKKILVEERQSSKREKEDILRDLRRLKTFRGGLLLAVMGGSLSEGIDYKDNLLDCVVVVGLPLPPPSLEQKELINYYDRKFGFKKGEEYGYISPAMNRVLQAMGRCIRSETDRATVLLMDDRYNEFRYKKFFPKEITVNPVTDIRAELNSFYDK
jgi:DNA excision repair protein ERCC-2